LQTGGRRSGNLAMSTPAPTIALFISDLHLQQSHPRTADGFFRFLAQHAAAARELYLLGDLFEYWAGDDDLDTPFHDAIIKAIRAVADAGVAVFWIAGNRDFLVGRRFAQAAGLTLLAEPHVATIAGRRIALVHGDAECSADRATWRSAPRCATRNGSSSSWRCRWRSASRSSPACAKAAARRTAATPWKSWT
jgi:UDP-2,3-diacylglucosamine hydrolase